MKLGSEDPEGRFGFPKGIEVMPDPDPEDRPIGWLLEQRGWVQSSALQLFDAINANRLRFAEADENVAGLLIGAAFSLWRAVFIAPREPTRVDQMIDKGMSFLERVLRDNTIGYGDEKNRRHWSYGYYLNSARFRLFHAKKIQSPDQQNWPADDAFLSQPRGLDLDIGLEWDRHQRVFNEVLAEFIARFQQRP